MEQNVTAQQNATFEAVIIRADGRRENLGVIVGGTRWQKVASYFRIKFFNFKQWLTS